MLNLFTSRNGTAESKAASPIDDVVARLEASVEEDPKTGRFRCRRDIFTDPELFELEMKHIWEGNWIYLAHESQIPNKNDYLTGHIGRQPIVISRDRNGELQIGRAHV